MNKLTLTVILLLISALSATYVSAQETFTPKRFAVKTNLAEAGAGIANIEAEIRTSSNTSVTFPVAYSPYTISDCYNMRVLTFQPEFRYWTGHAMKGHFIGAHATAGWFNIAVDRLNRYQSPKDRPAFGAGITYGYCLEILPELAFEFSLGAGYVNISYESFYNTDNGAPSGKGRIDYWGIDKISIGIIYRFNLSGKSGRSK